MQHRFVNPHVPARALALAVTAALALAACGGDDDDSAEPATPTEAPAVATEPPAATAAATPPPATEPTATEPTGTGAASDAGAPVVSVAPTSLGDVLVDQNGLTLYGFTPDTDGVSTCYGDCAAAWPPVLVDAGTELAVGEGLDAAMFTTVARDDTDQLQVVFGDWPLYTFAGDQAAGDVNGQGVNDVWYVVATDGQLMMPAGLTSGSDPGYGY